MHKLKIPDVILSVKTSELHVVFATSKQIIMFSNQCFKRTLNSSCDNDDIPNGVRVFEIVPNKRSWNYRAPFGNSRSLTTLMKLSV